MKHTIGVLMENKPGVLSRISTLLARRSFNIDSITAGPTRQIGVTRMTVIVDGDEYIADAAATEISKLEDVVEVERIGADEETTREIVLLKVRADACEREKLAAFAEGAGASVAAVSETVVLLEYADEPEKIDAFADSLSEWEIVDMARSGAIALKTSE